MSVTLPPDVENRIRDWFERGRYATVAEAIEAAVRFFDEHDRWTRLQAAIVVADAQVARGEAVELTPAVWDAIEQEADEAERRGLPLDPDVIP